MSIIKQLVPQCDICNATFPDLLELSATVQTLRSAMRREGWRRRGGDDVCPICAEQMEFNGVVNGNSDEDADY
jgi:hypothetical protein